jgi:hypothetical protein
MMALKRKFDAPPVYNSVNIFTESLNIYVNSSGFDAIKKRFFPFFETFLPLIRHGAVSTPRKVGKTSRKPDRLALAV